MCLCKLIVKVPQGAWFPLALGVAILSITYLWHYGATQRFKYTSNKNSRVEDLLDRENRSVHPPLNLEVECQQTSTDGPWMKRYLHEGHVLHVGAHVSSVTRRQGNAGLKEFLLCSSCSLVLRNDGMRLLRVPGLALYYTESIITVPGSFKRLLLKTPVLHRTIVFITVSQVHFPHLRLPLAHVHLQTLVISTADSGMEPGSTWLMTAFHRGEECYLQISASLTDQVYPNILPNLG